jgi:hypothetical protein
MRYPENKTADGGGSLDEHLGRFTTALEHGHACVNAGVTSLKGTASLSIASRLSVVLKFAVLSL